MKSKTLQFIIGLAMLLWAASGVAAPTDSSPGKLESVADGIQTLYRGIETLKLTFVQETKLELLGKAVRKTGQMWFKRPGRFFIHYETPPLKDYISNGTKLWVVLPEEEKVYQTDIKKGEMDEQAKIFLEGLGNLKKSFLVSFLSKEQEAAALFSKNDVLIHLQLIPVEESSFFIWIALAVNRQTYEVTEMTLFNHSQNVSHYVFSGFDKNPSVEESKFVLPKELKSRVEMQ